MVHFKTVLVMLFCIMHERAYAGPVYSSFFTKESVSMRDQDSCDESIRQKITYDLYTMVQIATEECKPKFRTEGISFYERMQDKKIDSSIVTEKNFREDLDDPYNSCVDIIKNYFDTRKSLKSAPESVEYQKVTDEIAKDIFDTLRSADMKQKVAKSVNFRLFYSHLTQASISRSSFVESFIAIVTISTDKLLHESFSKNFPERYR